MLMRAFIYLGRDSTFRMLRTRDAEHGALYHHPARLSVLFRRFRGRKWVNYTEGYNRPSSEPFSVKVLHFTLPTHWSSLGSYTAPYLEQVVPGEKAELHMIMSAS